jgi:hypothetical protein
MVHLKQTEDATCLRCEQFSYVGIIQTACNKLVTRELPITIHIKFTNDHTCSILWRQVLFDILLSVDFVDQFDHSS